MVRIPVDCMCISWQNPLYCPHIGGKCCDKRGISTEGANKVIPMTTTTTTTLLACPSCAGPIEAAPHLVGEIIDCTDCGTELEVTGLAPTRLAIAPEVEEDWGE